jgi:hypothetical protein
MLSICSSTTRHLAPILSTWCVVSVCASISCRARPRLVAWSHAVRHQGSAMGACICVTTGSARSHKAPKHTVRADLHIHRYVHVYHKIPARTGAVSAAAPCPPSLARMPDLHLAGAQPLFLCLLSPRLVGRSFPELTWDAPCSSASCPTIHARTHTLTVKADQLLPRGHDASGQIRVHLKR